MWGLNCTDPASHGKFSFAKENFNVPNPGLYKAFFPVLLLHQLQPIKLALGKFSNDARQAFQ